MYSIRIKQIRNVQISLRFYEEIVIVLIHWLQILQVLFTKLVKILMKECINIKNFLV